MKELKSGKALSPRTYIKIIADAIKKGCRNSSECHGWVLDGFPNTQAQANALMAANIIPTNAISLSGGIYRLNLAISGAESEYKQNETHVFENFVEKLTTLALMGLSLIGFKEAMPTILSIFEDAQLNNTWIEGDRTPIVTFTAILQAIDIFLPKASNSIQ